MNTLQAIKFEDGKLEILDQLLLPQVSKRICLKDTNEGWSAIRNMQVRGAPAIALVGCLSLASELLKDGFNQQADRALLHEHIVKKLNFLATARPTAVNMKNAAVDLGKYSKSLLMEEMTVHQHIEKIVSWCKKMFDDDVKTNSLLGDFGAQDVLKRLEGGKKAVILTHCNTGSLATAGYGTALGVIRSLAANNKLEHVYCTETRPYNQGARLTAYELVHDGLPSTLICDSMVAALMKERRIDAVILGADRTAKNGDTANKIGTYQIAILAKYHNVPFYHCVPTTTIDFSLEDGTSFPIEERPPKEMTSIEGVEVAAPGINCWNPSFDVTPAELITGGIVTEKGVFRPSQLANLAIS